MMQRLRGLVREPLVHFLLIGLVLFVIERQTGPAGPVTPSISIGTGEIANLENLFERTWNREPTAAEADSLIAALVREEMLAREALAMGLGENDPVIRRRLVQKIEFLIDDLAARGEPEDAVLEAFLDEHAERFEMEPRFSFEQVFLDPANRAPREIEALLVSLDAGARASEAGDPSMLPARVENAPLSRIAGMIGEEFAGAVEGLQDDSWSGPIRSTFGLHLVRVTGREPARMPDLAEIRERVLLEWREDQRRKAHERYLDDLRTRYTIEIERAP